MKGIWLCLLAGCGLAASAWAQQSDGKLTARELFYSAVDTPAPAAHKGDKPAPKPKPAHHKSIPAVEETASGRAPATPAPTSSQSVPVMNAAYRPSGTRPALGLTYTIL